MDRSKIVAVVTGAISVFLAVVYLILVQLLDLRGEMQPAPVGQLGAGSAELTYLHDVSLVVAPEFLNSAAAGETS